MRSHSMRLMNLSARDCRAEIATGNFSWCPFDLVVNFINKPFRCHWFILVLAAVAAHFSWGMDALASQYPYSCTWRSQVSPNAAISFSSTNGVGTYNGAFYYKGRKVMAFHEGDSQGYGTNWWSSSMSDNARGGDIVLFVGDLPARSLHQSARTGSISKLLIVGLGGSGIWYGDDFSLRDDSELIMAAEGFWAPSSGCRYFN